MSKTTLDLSTLSDIADGAHTVKVKAKADGYRDSEFSNEVSYTKAPAGYSGTVTKEGVRTVYYEINKDTITSSKTLSGGQHNFTGVVTFYCEASDSDGLTLYDNVNCSDVKHNNRHLITPTADNFSIVVNADPVP